MQCACAVLSSVACPALLYFSTLSHTRHDFRKKQNVTEHKTCFDFLCNISLKHVILRIDERDTIINVHGYVWAEKAQSV
jgi:hypothetical protein